jgi:SAM-dependent methyltransferase
VSAPSVAAASPDQLGELVLPYRPLERAVLAGLPEGARVLDLGCSGGANTPATGAGARVFGVDPSLPRLAGARELFPVAAAAGELLPFRDGVFELLYVSHVLHHASDHRAVLREAARVLAPEGLLLLIETTDDSPVMRLARAIRPEWDSDPIRSRFRFRELVAAVENAGLEVRERRQFNVLYWIWEVAQSRVRPLAGLLRFVVRAELAALRRWRAYGAHGYVLAAKPELWPAVTPR